MMSRSTREGRVVWIGLRPGRRAAVASVDTARILPSGLEGDHARPGKRALTLIQGEHLPVIADLLDQGAIDPAVLRRKIVVSGLNLLGFRKSRLRIGPAVIEITGPCPPCSRMEEALGYGGYTAMRGHGGVYASVITPGLIETGSLVTPDID